MTWFKNQKISKKLIIGFLIVAIIAAVVGVIGIISIISIRNADEDLYEQDTLSLQYTGDAAVTFQQLRYNMLKVTTQDDAAAIENIKTENIEICTTIGDLIDKSNEKMKAEELVTLLNEIKTQFADYQEYMNQFF